MWEAMHELWLELGLTDRNSDDTLTLRWDRTRRGWFYTGGGPPLNPDGTLTTSGKMHERQLPIPTGKMYLEEIVAGYTEHDNVDAAFRCLILDNTGLQDGMRVNLCHSDEVKTDRWILVGEAIATDLESRKGAPWYGALDFGRAPWWHVRTTPPIEPSIDLGYNTQWTNSPLDQSGDRLVLAQLYFVVSTGSYPYLYSPPPAPASSDPGTGQNMTISNIYRFILKGGTPVAEHPDVQRKVGAAWNYATGRMTASRVERVSRYSRQSRV